MKPKIPNQTVVSPNKHFKLAQQMVKYVQFCYPPSFLLFYFLTLFSIQRTFHQ